MNYWYFNTSDGPVLCGGCRSIDKKYHLIQVKDKELTPFFGILENDMFKLFDLGDEVRDLWEKFEKGPNSLYGEKTLRVFTKFPWQVRKLRKEFR